MTTNTTAVKRTAHSLQNREGDGQLVKGQVILELHQVVDIHQLLAKLNTETHHHTTVTTAGKLVYLSLIHI